MSASCILSSVTGYYRASNLDGFIVSHNLRVLWDLEIFKLVPAISYIYNSYIVRFSIVCLFFLLNIDNFLVEIKFLYIIVNIKIVIHVRVFCRAISIFYVWFGSA